MEKLSTVVLVLCAMIDGGGSGSVLSRDAALASRLGVEATPTFPINDTRFVGALPLATLDHHISRAAQVAHR